MRDSIPALHTSSHLKIQSNLEHLNVGLCLQAILLIWCKETLGSDVGLEFCQQNGFSSNLLCSSCRELEQFSLQPLIEPCNQCCQQDADASQAKQVVYVVFLVIIGINNDAMHLLPNVLYLGSMAEV